MTPVAVIFAAAELCNATGECIISAIAAKARCSEEYVIEILSGYIITRTRVVDPKHQCKKCIYRKKEWRDGGWCYMFKDHPQVEACAQRCLNL